MRRKDREVTDPKEIERILAKTRILHLGLFDEAYPYVVPLHYGHEWSEGHLRLYMHGALQGHKLDLIAANPHVCVELDCDAELMGEGDRACRYGSSYASVICRGVASLVEDPKEKVHGLKVLMREQTGRDFAIDEHMAHPVAVVCVDVDELSAKERPLS